MHNVESKLPHADPTGQNTPLTPGVVPTLISWKRPGFSKPRATRIDLHPVRSREMFVGQACRVSTRRKVIVVLPLQPLDLNRQGYSAATGTAEDCTSRQSTGFDRVESYDPFR